MLTSCEKPSWLASSCQSDPAFTGSNNLLSFILTTASSRSRSAAQSTNYKCKDMQYTPGECLCDCKHLQVQIVDNLIIVSNPSAFCISVYCYHILGFCSAGVFSVDTTRSAEFQEVSAKTFIDCWNFTGSMPMLKTKQQYQSAVQCIFLIPMSNIIIKQRQVCLVPHVTMLH